MSTIVEQLMPFCHDYLPSIALPFAYVEPDGSRWLAATNGHALLMARTNEPAPERSADAPPPPSLGTIIHRRPGASLVDVQALRDWCGDPPICGACEGTGKVPHECACKHCEWDGEDACRACASKKEPGTIGGVPFNRGVLRSLVRTLTDGAYRVSVGGATDPLTIWNEGWIAVAMPVRSDEGGPAFALPTETAP